VEGGCKKGEVEKFEGIHLPWQLEIIETEKKFLSKIEATTSGEPGWSITCNTIGGSKTDECISEKEKPEQVLLENKRSGIEEKELLVLGKFEERIKGKCTEGGAESASIKGQFAILLAKPNSNEPSGLGLSINGV
jgi:hypothetical protein